MKQLPSHAVWLLSLLASVAVAAPTLSVQSVLDAIRQVESNDQPYAIRDNSANRAYLLPSMSGAIAKAKELLALQHNLDLGLYQVNSIQLSRPGVSVDNVFDPSIQASLAAQVFDEFYTQSKAIHGDTDTALWRAVGAYNMGVAGLYRDNVPYLNRVMAAMGLAPKPEIGGAWAQGAVPRVPGNPLFEPTPKFQILGEWRIGDPISFDAPEAVSRPAARSNWSPYHVARVMGGVLALLLLVLLLVLLAKIGLLVTVVKLLGRQAVATAARQMARSRRVPSS